jgi:hypothetical protein
VYHFDMLDWDDDHKVRVFRLAALPRDSLERCAAVFAQSEAPGWPLWVPWFRTSPPDEARAEVSNQVQAVLDKAAPADRVVAWTGYAEDIVAASGVPHPDLADTPNWFDRDVPNNGQDWFSWLGLPRKRTIPSEGPLSR